jgi:predicted ATPase
MDTTSARVGHHIANDLSFVVDPVLTPEALSLVSASMLIGGEPGSGKSALLNLLAVHEALSAEDSTPGNATGQVVA